MATNAFKSMIHHHNTLQRRHPIDHYPSTTKHTFFLNPTTPTPTPTPTPTLSLSTTFAISSTTPTPTTPTPTTPQTNPFDVLIQHLSTKNYREADEETRRLLIVLAGEQAVKRGYVFFSEVQFIPEDDLKTIDKLWRENSDGKFGYSVQKKIWKRMNKDFTKFFIKVRWMKRLESSEVEQYNYRAFPNEFLWEMEEDTPEGHLPLTNALRGTQLLTCIFNHPAFEDDDEEEEESEVKEQGSSNGSKGLGSRTFKTSYTF